MARTPKQIDQADVLNRLRDLQKIVKTMKDQIKPARTKAGARAGVEASKDFIAKKAELVKILK